LFILLANTLKIVRGFYRGLTPPLISLTFLNSLSFGAYSQFKRLLGGDTHPLKPYHYFLAGGGNTI
jgi:hypothetical protein